MNSRFGFLICITVRLAIAYMAFKIFNNGNPDIFKKLAYLALIPILGWLYIIFISPRDTGFEATNGIIWWQKWRYLHLIMYMLFFSLSQSSYYHLAWIPLLIDPIIGITAWMIKWVF